MTGSRGTGVPSVALARPRRFLLAAFAALLALGTILAIPLPAQADDGDLVIELTGISPAVLRTGDELTVTGQITNNTDAELPPPDVRLLMQKHVPSSTDALADWLDGSSDLNVAALTGWNPATEDGEAIPAGGSVRFRIQIGTDGTFDQLSSWGPRGIEIQARTEALEASVRTTLIWYPTDAPIDAPAEITMLVPLTPTAQEWSTATADGVPVGEVAAPRLLAVLDAVGPEASIAVDPALFDDNPPGAAAPTADQPGPNGEGQADLAELEDRLSRPDTRRDVIPLGYADADLTTLDQTGGRVLWEDGVDHGQSLLDTAGIELERVAWPAGTVSAGALTTLVQDGAKAVVLDADDVAAAPPVGSRATVDSPAGPLDALVADSELSAALTSTSATGVAASQATLALSAVKTRALPQGSAGFLVVLPRAVGVGDLEELSDRVDALLSAPWTQATNMRSLLGSTAAGGTVLELPEVVEVADAISATEVDDLLEARDLVAAYAQAAGESIVEEQLPGLLQPLSATLNLDPSLREELLGATSTATDALGASIQVEAGSDVLLISEGGSIPVTIANTLPVEAQVYVQLVPEGTRVQVTEVPQATLPLGSPPPCGSRSRLSPTATSPSTSACSPAGAARTSRSRRRSPCGFAPTGRTSAPAWSQGCWRWRL